MANTRTRHIVGGGLGTFRKRDAELHALRTTFQQTQRAFRHQHAVTAMHAAAVREHDQHPTAA